LLPGMSDSVARAKIAEVEIREDVILRFDLSEPILVELGT